jgi:hypothetical protein
LRKIHQTLEGRGYLPLFQGSKNLRDTESGVRIEFLVSGQYPGDGKPKPVAFPDPTEVALEKDGIRYLNLASLIELKLASGISSAQRIKDLADVQELIKLLNLPQEFAASLNAYVRDQYHELWRSVNGHKKRYLALWGNLQPNQTVQSIDDLRTDSGKISDLLEAMKGDGVQLELRGNRVYLLTTDSEIAKKYEMHDEADFWIGDDMQE